MHRISVASVINWKIYSKYGKRIERMVLGSQEDECFLFSRTEILDILNFGNIGNNFYP